METGVSEAPLSFETTIVTRIYHSTSRNIPQFFFFYLYIGANHLTATYR